MRLLRRTLALAIAAVVVTALVLACGSASSPPTPLPSGSLAAVATESPLTYPSYATPSGGGSATPYPLACARWSVKLPHAGVTLPVIRGTPPVHVDVRTGQSVLLTAEERCEFAWQLNSVQSSDSSVLAVLGRSAPPAGVQGTGWVDFQAVAPGTARIGVSGSCSMPAPAPAEPSGVELICSSVAYAFTVTVTVLG